MMENVYRGIVNAQGRKSLLKCPVMPDKSLGIGADEYLADVPLLIFTEQHLPAQRPVVVSPYSLPYEKTAQKGAGDAVSIEMFDTANFDIGEPFTGV